MDLVPISEGSLLELLEPHQVERQVERLQRFVQVVVEPGMVVEAVDVGTFLEGQAGMQLLEHWVEVEDNIGPEEAVEIPLKVHIINSVVIRIVEDTYLHCFETSKARSGIAYDHSFHP